MGLYKVVRGAGGARTMQQYATPEEEANKDRGKDMKTMDEAVEEAVLAELDLEKPQVKEAKTPVEDQSPAFKVLMQSLNKQSVSWAKKYISKLDTQEEIAAVRMKEERHPKHVGGRVGVMDALQKQEDSLKSPSTEEEEEDLNCPNCDFVAGSSAGLKAHIDASHDL